MDNSQPQAQRPPHAVVTQLAAWTAALAWYPLWRLSAQQETMACDSKRPSMAQAFASLRQLAAQQQRTSAMSVPRALYSGLVPTLALQPLVYPTSIMWAGWLRDKSGCTLAQSYMLAGATLSPLICAPWKTWILGDPVTRAQMRCSLGLGNARLSALAKKGQALQPFRGLIWWAGRNGTVLPCIFYGPKLFRQLIPEDWQKKSPKTVLFASWVGAGTLAAAVSQPCDLITGLLNGDPFRAKYANGRDAIRQLIAKRGIAGFAIASTLRVAQFSTETALLGASSDAEPGPLIALWRSIFHRIVM